MLHGRTRCLSATLGATLLLLLMAPAAAAQDDGLLVTAHTRYRVLPAEGRVQVSIQAVATSRERDTPEGRVYFSGVAFAVPAGASNVNASSGGVPLAVEIIEQTEDYIGLDVTFNRRVFFGESYAYTVSFDLRDSGGAGDRDVRLGQSVVAFPVWAFGSEEPGSSVRVELPADYQVNVQGSPMSGSTAADGGTILTAEPNDPFAFFAYVAADSPGAFSDVPLEVGLEREPARLVVRAWQDDPDWGRRMGELMAEGLPALEAAIGVPYPHAGRLRLEEAAISRLGEYAGLYDPAAGVIRVRYDADAYVALHEAAHVWFNDRLFDERWIGEAWAEYYAVQVGETIGAGGQTWELTDDLLRSRIPLNDWGGVGRENLAVEDFAYAASYELAGLIAERTHAAGLQRVWQAGFAHEPAYLPQGGSWESEGRARLGQPGWQRLLDLLEERTGQGFADLWAAWVVNDDQEPMLALRATARSEYGDVLAIAAGWELPQVIRLSLGDWRFQEARRDLREAQRILDDRDRIASLAADLELHASDRLRLAFEDGDDLGQAARLADLELETLEQLAVAGERLSGEPGVLESIGLLGSQPRALLDRARDAYQRGELGAAERVAADAIERREAAAAEGRSRVTLGAAALLGVDGLALVALSARRLRRDAATLPVP